MARHGTTHTDRLSQVVTLPATTTGVTLTFFLHVATEEQTTTQAFDKLRVHVRDAAGRIQLEAVKDNASATSFVVDDFRLWWSLKSAHQIP